MDITDKKCPDCESPLRAIKILNDARYGVKPLPGEMIYMAVEAKQSFWTGRYPVEGQVAACMCDGCGRILLYGVPRAKL